MSTPFNAALSELTPTPLGSYILEGGNVFRKEVHYHIYLPPLRSALTELKTSAQTDPKMQTLTPEMQKKVCDGIRQLESDLNILEDFMNDTMPKSASDLSNNLKHAKAELSTCLQRQADLALKGNINDYSSNSITGSSDPSAFSLHRLLVELCEQEIAMLKKRIFMLENTLNHTDGNGFVHYATEDDGLLNSRRIPFDGYSVNHVEYKIQYHYNIKEGKNEVRVEVTPLHIPDGAPTDKDTKTEISMLESRFNPRNHYFMLEESSNHPRRSDKSKELARKQLAEFDEKCKQKATTTKVVEYCRKTTLHGIPAQLMDTLVSDARQLSELYNAPVSTNNNTTTTTTSNNNAEPAPAAPVTLTQPTATAWPKTPVTVKCNAGWGKSLYVYGTGAEGMSWEKGIKMNCSNGDAWSVELPSNGATLSFKIVLQGDKDGKLWEVGSNHDVKAGDKVSVDSIKFKA